MVGICGFDIFAECIVEVCAADYILLTKTLFSLSVSSSSSLTKRELTAVVCIQMAYDEGTISLFDSSTYKLSYAESLQWHVSTSISS